MSTMTGTPVSPMRKLVAPIMAELRELAGERTSAAGTEIVSAIVNIMVLEQGIERDSLPPGIKVILADCQKYADKVWELKYFEVELYGAFN